MADDRDWHALFLVAEHWLGDHPLLLTPCALEDFALFSTRLARILSVIQQLPRDVDPLSRVYLLTSGAIALTPHLLSLLHLLSGVRPRTLLKLPPHELLFLLDATLQLNAESKELFSASSRGAAKAEGGTLGTLIDLLIHRGYTLDDIRRSSLAALSVYVREAVAGREDDRIDRLVTAWKGTHLGHKQVNEAVRKYERTRKQVVSGGGGEEDPKLVNSEWRRLKSAMARLH